MSLKCIVVKRTGNYINWDNKRDVWYHDLIKDVSNNCEPEEMNAEDPLFILYTSGPTSKEASGEGKRVRSKVVVSTGQSACSTATVTVPVMAPPVSLASAPKLSRIPFP